MRLDGDTQPRAKIDTQAVADYAERIEAGDELPPIDVYFDGSAYWIADGFHRWHAHRKLGHNLITCIVHTGTVEDARWHAIGANKAHGLRRTNEDKAKAVKAALQHPKGAEWSDVQIAEHVGVSDKTVAKYRTELTATSEIPKLTTRTGKDGKTRRVPKRKTPIKPPVDAGEPDPELDEEEPRAHQVPKLQPPGNP